MQALIYCSRENNRIQVADGKMSKRARSDSICIPLATLKVTLVVPENVNKNDGFSHKQSQQPAACVLQQNDTNPRTLQGNDCRRPKKKHIYLNSFTKHQKS